MKILWKNVNNEVAVTVFADKFIARLAQLKVIYDTYNLNEDILQNELNTIVPILFQRTPDQIIDPAVLSERQNRYNEILKIFEDLHDARKMKLSHGLTIQEVAEKIIPPAGFTYVKVGDISIPVARANRSKWRLDSNNEIVELPTIPGPL